MSHKKWKIIADENIPYARDLFSTFGELILRPGREICPEDLEGADILLVRSVTRVNRALLEGSAVKFVGTCTIGLDHLDIPYLESKGINWSSAPGCNAGGVVQYVLSAMASCNLLGASPRVGIVGCGNVGGRLYKTLASLGLECIGVDPFLEENALPCMGKFASLYDCDFISVHTPLTVDGPEPTHHLFNEAVFPRLKPGAVLLNAGRGGVIDNQALFEYLQNGGDLKVILDVWENEPDIHRQLLAEVTLASPHIAGYSFEGRVNGSLMIYEALAVFARSHSLSFLDVLDEVKARAFGQAEMLYAENIHEAILSSYHLQDDHQLLKNKTPELPQSFDELRKNYRKRREPSHYQLTLKDKVEAEKAQVLGFQLVGETA